MGSLNHTLITVIFALSTLPSIAAQTCQGSTSSTVLKEISVKEPLARKTRSINHLLCEENQSSGVTTVEAKQFLGKAPGSKFEASALALKMFAEELSGFNGSGKETEADPTTPHVTRFSDSIVAELANAIGVGSATDPKNKYLVRGHKSDAWAVLRRMSVNHNSTFVASLKSQIKTAQGEKKKVYFYSFMNADGHVVNFFVIEGKKATI